MKFISIFFTLGMSLNISTVAIANTPFSVALMNVESFDWSNPTDRFVQYEQKAVQALVAAQPATAEEAVAKARALMMALKSQEILFKHNGDQKTQISPGTRELLHSFAWSGLIELGHSKFASVVQPEVILELPQNSSHMQKFMNLVSSFIPSSQSVRESIVAFVTEVASDICRKTLATPQPVNP